MKITDFFTFIQNPQNPDNEDGMRNVAERHLGAFGFPAPYGHWPLGFERVSFNMDIVGGVLAPRLCRGDVTRRVAAPRTAAGSDCSEGDYDFKTTPYRWWREHIT